MSSQIIPAASQVCIDLVENRFPTLIEQIIPALIAIEIADGEKIVGQITGADTSFKLTWMCEFSRTNPSNKDILVEIAYGSYTLQGYAIIPVVVSDTDTGVAIDQNRKRLRQSGAKNSMIACLPLRDIASMAKEMDTLVADVGFISAGANYRTY